jgi:sucrose-phosphate synthase
MRHPQWQDNAPEDDVDVEESFNDSLKDVQDMSLRLSIDGEFVASGGSNEDQVKRLLSKIRKQDSGSNNENLLLDNVPNKYPLLRRRRRLIVIALDSYDSNGFPDKKLIEVVQTIVKAVQLDPQTARVSGFALSTAMTMQETLEFLTSGNIQANEFDAIICSSGSEVYYPGVHTEDGKLSPDQDYAVHIDYRWGVEGLKSTIGKLMNASDGDANNKKTSPIEEDLKSSNAHCISYKIKDLSKVSEIY